ncbi:hypothetical protein MA546_11070 [Streptomyces sp. T7(2022)]|uniref:hypothetical protein n=1 Tax=Streptomyces sp. T7(2022) TaxID=2916034 RepID=UPI001EE4DFB6|nr:hypothetical protein [Streptomyces sp. T7(2022)]MCG5119307.1 hypothetical protein [Streptomyces sp. T7(2022)]
MSKMVRVLCAFAVAAAFGAIASGEPTWEFAPTGEPTWEIAPAGEPTWETAPAGEPTWEDQPTDVQA